MADQAPWGFESARRQAEGYAADREKVSSLLGDAERKARENRRRLASVWENLQALFRLVSAWVRGHYTVIPWPTIVLALAAIIYFLNPFDLFPDLVPMVGYLDDAGVLAFVVRAIQKDISAFLQWERSAPSRGAE